MRFILQLRFKQFIRAVRSAGVGILLVLVAVTAGIWAPALAQLASWPAPVVCAVSSSAGLALHLFRRDASLLAQLTRPAWHIRFADASLLSGILAFAVTAGGGGISSAVAALSGVWTAFLPGNITNNKVAQANSFSIPYLPLDLFELQAAFRRFHVLWLFPLLAQYFVWKHIAFLAISGALMLTAIAGVYEYFESKELLPPTRKDLYRKCLRNTAAFQALLAPGYILCLSAQSEFWWVALYVFAAVSLMCCLCIALKYALWQPGRRRQTGVQSGIAIMMLITPFGVLPAAAMTFYYTRDALRLIDYQSL